MNLSSSPSPQFCAKLSANLKDFGPVRENEEGSKALTTGEQHQLLSLTGEFAGKFNAIGTSEDTVLLCKRTTLGVEEEGATLSYRCTEDGKRREKFYMKNLAESWPDFLERTLVNLQYGVENTPLPEKLSNAISRLFRR